MRKRWRFFLTLALVLLAGGLLLLPSVRWPVLGWLRGESFCRGMPASYWRQRIQNHADAKIARDATVPVFVGMLASVGIPVPFDDPRRTPEVLEPEHADAFALLIELLPDDDDRVCLSVLSALAARPDAQAAVPAIAHELQHPEPLHRKRAILALQVIVPADEAVVPALVRALEDDDPTVAYNAAVTLGLMGQKARAAIPALTQALRSDRAVRPVPLVNRQVADGVGMALRQIDPAGAAKVGLK